MFATPILISHRCLSTGVPNIISNLRGELQTREEERGEGDERERERETRERGGGGGRERE